MRQNFHKSLAFVLMWERGYVNDPDDPGKETKWGISKKSHPELDIKNLTVKEAGEIYLKKYWIPLGCDDLEWPKDIVAFDTGVNQGEWTARAVVHSGPWPVPLFRRLEFYSALVKRNPRLLKFLRGWLNRVLQLHRYVEKCDAKRGN